MLKKEEIQQGTQQEVTVKKKINRKFLIAGIIVSALVILTIIILIFPSKEDGKGILPKFNDSQEDSKGGLSSLLPKKETKETTP